MPRHIRFTRMEGIEKPKICWFRLQNILYFPQGTRPMREKPDYYDFDGLRLFVTDNHLVNLKTGAEFTPSNIHRQFLLVLARNAPKVISYEQLLVEVWRSDSLDHYSLRKIRETKRQLVRFLQNCGVPEPSIVTDHGYGLNCPVTSGYESGISGQSSNEVEKVIDPDSWKNIFRAHIAYVLTVSICYGLLYLIAAVMEAAYEFETSGQLALQLGLISTLLNGVTFLVASMVICIRISAGKRGFLLGIGILFLAVAITILISAQYMPFRPVTRATFQTQPAFIAFGKNALVYFLPFAVVFLLLPFYIVSAKRSMRSGMISKLPFDSVLVKPRWLFVLAITTLIFSGVTTNYMLDRLRAEHIHHSLFVGMVLLRFVVLFSLAIGASIWYYLHENRHRKFH